MAQFENVNFEFYSKTLGRSVVPTLEEFDARKLENTLQMQCYLDAGIVCEKQLNGIDSAVCMWIEEDYKATQVETGAAAMDNSASIGGYSYSVNTKSIDSYIDKNLKSVAQKKYHWLDLFCYLDTAKG